MANSYTTLPFSALDDLSSLNGALSAFDELLTAWLVQTMRDGPAGDREHFPTGVRDLLRPVIEGFQRIEAEAAGGTRLGESDLPTSTLPGTSGD